MTTTHRQHRPVGRIAAAFLVLFGCVAGPLSAEQVVEWRNVPIPIVLSVGEERVLAFPDHVEVGVPAHLTPSVLRTQSTGGTVLWLARQAFQTERLQVRLLTTGHVLLFDVTAVDAPTAANTEPVRIVFPAAAGDGVAIDATAVSTLTPVSLTRFAAQQLYAPQRLLGNVAGPRRVPMGVPESIDLIRHHDIDARPLASWQGGGYFVTAVRLTNRQFDRVMLDPRELRGHFVTATFHHNSLGPKGSRSDTTCVYVVTDRPFADAIAAALAPRVLDSEE